MWFEELERAAGAFHELRERAAELGDEASVPYVLVLLSQTECLSGRFEDALRHAEAARELAEQARQTTLVAYALAVAALADAHRGREEATRARAERALELAEQTRGTPALQFATAALGLLELSLERPAEALARLSPLFEAARANGMNEPGLTRFALDLAQALIDLDRPDEAEPVLVFEENARRLEHFGALGSALRTRATLETARGRTTQRSSCSPARSSSTSSRRCRSTEHARSTPTGWRCGGSSTVPSARTALDAAERAFRSLGAEVWAERAREDAQRVGGRRRTEGVLTATERRVAELVAEGRSNKEVAAALFVTPKTVETQLTRIYAKLGVRSRTALARRLTEL